MFLDLSVGKLHKKSTFENIFFLLPAREQVQVDSISSAMGIKTFMGNEGLFSNYALFAPTFA